MTTLKYKARGISSAFDGRAPLRIAQRYCRVSICAGNAVNNVHSVHNVQKQDFAIRFGLSHSLIQLASLPLVQQREASHPLPPSLHARNPSILDCHALPELRNPAPTCGSAPEWREEGACPGRRHPTASWSAPELSICSRSFEVSARAIRHFAPEWR